jgi:P27 family predicted phage terminase small subunit
LTRGRKPKPSALKILTGQDRADRMPKGEPVVTVMSYLPEPPSHLDDYALDEWHHICGALYRCGILTEIDGHGLSMYCQAYGRWRRAEEAIQKASFDEPSTGGLIIKTTNGNIIQNPMVGIANTAMRDAMKYAAEYGLTPSSRARLGSFAGSGEKTDPAERFFS